MVRIPTGFIGGDFCFIAFLFNRFLIGYLFLTYFFIPNNN